MELFHENSMLPIIRISALHVSQLHTTFTLLVRRRSRQDNRPIVNGDFPSAAVRSIGFGTFLLMAWVLCYTNSNWYARHECICIWQRAANDPKSRQMPLFKWSFQRTLVPLWNINCALSAYGITQTVNKTVPRTGNARPVRRHTIRSTPISNHSHILDKVICCGM